MQKWLALPEEKSESSEYKMGELFRTLKLNPGTFCCQLSSVNTTISQRRLTLLWFSAMPGLVQPTPPPLVPGMDLDLA